LLQGHFDKKPSKPNHQKQSTKKNGR